MIAGKMNIPHSTSKLPTCIPKAEYGMRDAGRMGGKFQPDKELEEILLSQVAELASGLLSLRIYNEFWPSIRFRKASTVCIYFSSSST